MKKLLLLLVLLVLGILAPLLGFAFAAECTGALSVRNGYVYARTSGNFEGISVGFTFYDSGNNVISTDQCTLQYISSEDISQCQVPIPSGAVSVTASFSCGGTYPLQLAGSQQNTNNNNGNNTSQPPLNCGWWCSDQCKQFCVGPFCLGAICDFVCGLCTMISILTNAINNVAGWFQGLISMIASAGQTIINGINAVFDFFSGIGSAIADGIGAIAKALTSIGSSIGSFFSGIASGIYNFFKGVGDIIFSFFKGVGDAVNGFFEWAGGVGSWLGSLDWNQILFMIGVILLIAGTMFRPALVAGILLVAYEMFRDPDFVAGLAKSPYLLIVAGAVILVIAVIKMRE